MPPFAGANGGRAMVVSEICGSGQTEIIKIPPKNERGISRARATKEKEFVHHAAQSHD